MQNLLLLCTSEKSAIPLSYQEDKLIVAGSHCSLKSPNSGVTTILTTLCNLYSRHNSTEHSLSQEMLIIPPLTTTNLMSIVKPEASIL
jgi:hypothetical protein